LWAVQTAGGSKEAGGRSAREVMARPSLPENTARLWPQPHAAGRQPRACPCGHACSPVVRRGAAGRAAGAARAARSRASAAGLRRGSDGRGCCADGPAARAQPSARLALLRQLPALAAALPGAGERVGALARVWAAAVGLDLDGRRAGRLRDRTAPAAELRALLSDPFLAAVISGAPDGARPALPLPYSPGAPRALTPEGEAPARPGASLPAGAAGAARPPPSTSV